MNPIAKSIKVSVGKSIVETETAVIDMLMECFLIAPSSRASVLPERKLGQKGVECRSLCAGEEVLQNSSNLVMHQMIYRIDNTVGNARDLIGAVRQPLSSR